MLKEGKAGSRDDVKDLMSGNLCRCGANVGIIDAIMEIKDGGTHE
jgi:xanthine dehydrogenase YagT iron-sulfur-binding subunit